MTGRRHRSAAFLLAAALTVSVAIVSAPEIASSTTPRLANPEDRYALAGGCYAVRALDDDALYIARAADGFTMVDELSEAEPFFFQATDLGRYLMFGTASDFLAASEGLVGEALGAVTGNIVGQDVGGLTLETTDAAAEAIADSQLGTATGRGASVVAAPAASKLADWEIREIEPGAFSIRLPATHQFLAAGNGQMSLEDVLDSRARFGFQLTEGCATFPEVEINVTGPVAGGATPFTEVRGYLDAHLHMMAYEFLGGRVRCGRPWHRFGVTRALVDCPDHEPGGAGAVLEDFLSGKTPGSGHDTVGWPTFGYWPRYDSLTHEQVYYKWMERAWRGGLRMFTNLLVDNNVLCKIYPFKRNSCNEMDGVRLQYRRIHELQDYIDAQSGGPGEGWFRIVTDPFQARRVINEGKLAVVLGIEVSVPLDCGVILDLPRCDTAKIDQQLDAVYRMGVRQMEITNKFDNALTGVTGDGGTTGIVVNFGNLLETGRWWQMQACEHADEQWHDKQQMNFHDDGGTPDELTGRDSLAGGVLAVSGASGAAPLYPQGPHCNTRGLTPLGEHLIRRMIDKGMIFDPDHMSATARREALDILEQQQYSGVVSSHSWADDTIYQRVYGLGGMVTPYAGGSHGFASDWASHRQWADPRFLFGFGYGADTNGFGSQGGPRGPNIANPATYPFAGFGGAMIDKQRSGERVYDINTDGVAHYGLYPDWIQDLRMIAGPEIIQDMERGPEAYLQMWERAIGITGDACRSDVADLTDAQIDALEVGMSPEAVLVAVGQPAAREGAEFRYCMSGARTATVMFTGTGGLASVDVT